MLDVLRRRLALGIAKNMPELRAFATGRMPPFVTQRRRTAFADPPVFFFHEVAPERFEHQLRHLQQNGYGTLDADQLEAAKRGDRFAGHEVALTFDDATSTLWTYAFPLLRRYGLRAIVFVIPGLVPDDAIPYANLDTLWAGQSTPADLAGRARAQPLCTWRELVLMHRSGLVDLQSHSLTHARVPISDRPVDFLHPRFDVHFYGNVNVPVASDDDPDRPARALRLGAPVFESASRLSGKPRFHENPAMVQAMAGHVAGQSPAFFARRDWRARLRRQFDAWPVSERGSYETAAETEAAIRRELVGSKDILATRLPDKPIRHFCYPWFQGCDLADRLAAEAGYRTLFCGLDTRDRRLPAPNGTIRIHRISEDYLLRLPGHGRSSMASVWSHRLGRFAGRLG